MALGFQFWNMPIVSVKSSSVQLSMASPSKAPLPPPKQGLDLLGLSTLTLSRKALCFSKFAAAFSCNHLRTFRYEGEVLSEGGPDAYLSNRYSTEAT